MNTTKSWIKGVLVLSLVAVLSGYGLATERLDDQRTMSDQPSWDWGVARQDAVQSQRGISGAEVGTNLHRASRLVGSSIRNFEGERLGSVYDLVLTPNLDDISYAVVSTGGIFGMGRQLHAIPWSAVQTGVDGKIVAPISAKEFAQDRGFAAWPTEGNPHWLSRADERTESARYRRATAADRESIQDRRFSRIKGTTLKGSEDRSIGTVHDLVVATDTGSVAYTIVSFGGILGLGPRYAAVPMNAIDFRPEQQIARTRVDRQALQAYAFSPTAFPNLSDPLYARQLNRAYGLEGYDTVLGYVPGEEPARQPAAPDTARRAPATGSTARGAGTITIDPGAAYHVAAVKTIQGVVTAVEKTARVGKGPENLLLHVRSDSGDLFYVHAGPLDYVSKQDFFVVNGDRVSVTGAPTQAGAHSVILAAQISKDDQVLQLRDREGKPLWEHSSAQEQKEQSGEAEHSTGHSSEGSSSQDTETPAP